MSIPKVQMPGGAPKLSRIAWGAGGIPVEAAHMLDICMECGITTMDCAEIYGGFTQEAMLGETLKLRPGIRDKLEIVTKCSVVAVTPEYPQYTMYQYDTTKKHIIAAAESSLKKIGTDRLDALLLHRWDPLLDADEVAEAFIRLQKSGKVLSFGVSNFAAPAMRLLASRLPFPLVTDQIELSVLHTLPVYDGTLDYCQELRMPPMAWSPQGGGKIFTGADERVQRVRAELKAIGEEIGASINCVALAWVLMHPSKPIVILGTHKEAHLRSAAQAADVSLTREHWYRILNASVGERIP